MAVALSTLVEEADRYLGSAKIADYCPNGLQVEGRPQVMRIVSGVTASQALLDAAVEAEADLVLVHHGYFWKGDRIVYAQDIGGDENFQLFSVKADGKDLKALTPFPGVRSDITDALIDIKGKEKELIVQINKRVKEYFDPYLLNVETGALTLLYDNKENFDGWFTDNNGIIRLASKTDGVNITWNYRNSEISNFKKYTKRIKSNYF